MENVNTEEFINNFGDYDLYAAFDGDSLYTNFYVKYHENVNQKNRSFLVDKKDTKCILRASFDYDNADNANDKWTNLQGIEDRLGLN